MTAVKPEKYKWCVTYENSIFFHFFKNESDVDESMKYIQGFKNKHRCFWDPDTKVYYFGTTYVDSKNNLEFHECSLQKEEEIKNEKLKEQEERDKELASSISKKLNWSEIDFLRRYGIKIVE